MTIKYIRFYECDLDEDAGYTLDVTLGAEEKTYPRLPSLAEINEAFGTNFTSKKVGDGHYPALFGAEEMVAAPRFPDDGIEYMVDGMSGTTAMKIPPMLQRVQDFSEVLEESGIVVPPTIPSTAVTLYDMFRNATALRSPASIPQNVKSIFRMYDGCTSLAGEMVVRPTSISSRSYALRDTTGPIILYGDQTLCGYIAATANNSNASWQPWYSPVEAVTDRGPDSYTTAEDMTRMVRNGVLAVGTYAPGRMSYQQGDIVREDEWRALVKAAQTIDPTVTYSTVYSNLNKIEAAFDSAL